jgi:tetratricopeptide (TPR) repeat protein
MYEKISSENYDVFVSKDVIFFEIGLICRDLSKIDCSLECLNDSLKREQKYWHIDPWNRASKLLSIGRIHMVKGEFEISLQFFEDALSQLQQHYNVKHVDISKLYYSKAIVLEFLRRNNEALIAFTKALDIQKTLFIEGHT